MQPQTIKSKIYEIRDQKVMLDYDLAELYEVDTKRLNENVKRNIKRFPEHFMFRLTIEEWSEMRSHFATASGQQKRNTFTTPYAFTEHGVTMLASVLKSDKAIQVNIAIIEAFIAMRQIALNYKEITNKLNQLEYQYNKKFKDVYAVLDHLLEKKELDDLQQNRERIGYSRGEH